MSSENIERQIEFILEHQAKFSEDLDKLKEVQSQQAANIDRLTADVQELTVNVNAMQVEMREGFENLIVANEVTRKLAEDVARLAVQTAQRVSDLESQQ
jgi:methyl-accepting chemotaxis protein